jgi:WhiB family redox-sensing transcriptional regulator
MRLNVDLPCQVHDPDLWFAEAPADLELAKALCARCPARLACLTGAVDRQEAADVWGGEIFDHGQLVTHKRPRGRPRKNSIPPQRYPARLAQLSAAHPAPECLDEEIDEIAIERAVSGSATAYAWMASPPPTRRKPFAGSPNAGSPSATSANISRRLNAPSPPPSSAEHDYGARAESRSSRQLGPT